MKKLISFLLLVLMFTPSFAWIDNYATRKPINITITENTTNYQVVTNVTYDSDMQSDFSDLNFTDENDNFLFHWIEDKVDSLWAKVWIKGNWTTENGTQLYMHYNNESAVTGTTYPFKVFNLFDDFNDDSINTTTWTIDSGTPPETNGMFTGVRTGTDIKMSSDTSFTGNSYALHYKGWHEDTDYNFIGFTNAGNAPQIINQRVTSGSMRMFINNTAYKTYTPSFSAWTTYELRRINNASLYKNDILVAYTGNNITDAGSADIEIWAYNTNQNFSINWIFVRNAINIEPTLTIGTEENKALSLSSNNTYPYVNEFINLTVTKTDGDLRKFWWDWGDGSALEYSENHTRLHQYTTVGNYWINITAYNNADQNYSTTKQINVTTELSVSDIIEIVGSSYWNRSTTYNSTVSGGKSPYTYAWDFGNLGTTTNTTPTITNNETTTRNITVVVTDAYSHTDTYYEVMTVDTYYTYYFIDWETNSSLTGVTGLVYDETNVTRVSTNSIVGFTHNEITTSGVLNIYFTKAGYADNETTLNASEEVWINRTIKLKPVQLSLAFSTLVNGTITYSNESYLNSTQAFNDTSLILWQSNLGSGRVIVSFNGLTSGAFIQKFEYINDVDTQLSENIKVLDSVSLTDVKFIVQSQGTPLEDAWIKVELCEDECKVIQAMLTDVNGETFCNLVDGKNYKISIVKTGYTFQPIRQNIQSDADLSFSMIASSNEYTSQRLYSDCYERYYTTIPKTCTYTFVTDSVSNVNFTILYETNNINSSFINTSVTTTEDFEFTLNSTNTYYDLEFYYDCEFLGSTRIEYKQLDELSIDKDTQIWKDNKEIMAIVFTTIAVVLAIILENLIKGSGSITLILAGISLYSLYNGIIWLFAGFIIIVIITGLNKLKKWR